MPKLAGQAYLDCWRTRMAQGADQAGFNGQDADRQGNEIWKFIEPWISGMKPRTVVDFGCGYGRMLRKMRILWPKSNLYGIDVCKEAIASINENWREPGYPKVFVQSQIPQNIRADLIFDCMVMQHITDDGILGDVVESFKTALRPGGSIVLFENIAETGAKHMRDMPAENYMALFPELKWIEYSILMLGFQAHALMIGTMKP
jgi:trans-aconitate methyltransferase